MANPRDKKMAVDFAALIENIGKSTPIDLHEKPADKRKRIAALEADPEAWFKYYFPAFAYSEPEEFHMEATRRIMDNPEWYEVRMWSRELAKSTRAMMEILYLCLTKKKRNVLIISNSFDNAVRLMDPFRANLESNDRIINDYGKQVKPGSWEAAEFITRSGFSFRAIGAGQSPRGTRNQEVRPDIILFDDIDTDEECRNPEIIKKKWKWIEEAVMPTRSISKATLIMFCGNRIATDCCVVRAIQFADKHDEINIRDEKGHSTWPAKNTEAHIDRVLSKLSYAAIQKEYYNNPINEGSVFKQINYKPVRPLKEYSTLCCYTDPSYKDTEKNDFKATVLVGLWQDEFHIIKALVFQGSISQMVENHYAVMDIVGQCTCYYLMEQVFMQDMFFTEFTKMGRLKGRQVPISGDQRAKPEKFARIEALLEPLNRKGQLYFNDAEKNDPGMKNLHQQFLAFASGSRAHDDGPDAVEGAVWTINNKQAIKASGNIIVIRRTINPAKNY